MLYVEGSEKLGKNGGKVKKQRVTVKGSYAVCDIFPGLPFFEEPQVTCFSFIYPTVKFTRWLFYNIAVADLPAVTNDILLSTPSSNRQKRNHPNNPS